MIVVKDVVIEEAERDEIMIAHYPTIQPAIFNVDAACTVAPEIETEYIRGRRYYLPDGRRLTIGWSRQTHEALKIPLDIIDNLNHENERLREKNIEQRDTINKQGMIIKDISNWGLWQRFKYLMACKII